MQLHTVINSVQVQLQQTISWGHDPFTHAYEARLLTVVGWTSLSVIVIVFDSCQTQDGKSCFSFGQVGLVSWCTMCPCARRSKRSKIHFPLRSPRGQGVEAATTASERLVEAKLQQAVQLEEREQAEREQVKEESSLSSRSWIWAHRNRSRCSTRRTRRCAGSSRRGSATTHPCANASTAALFAARKGSPANFPTACNRSSTDPPSPDLLNVCHQWMSDHPLSVIFPNP